MILGIDTATPTASVALVENGKLVAEDVRSAATESGSPPSSGRGNHAEILLPLIDTLLCRAGLVLTDIGALAVSIGPGSFTGLRIGLSTLKGLAFGWEIPVIGVPTLLALATRVTDWQGLVCPLLDARKKEVYAALFRQSAGKLERLTQDLACAADEIVERIKVLGGKEPCLFIGDGIKVYGNLIASALGGRGLLTLGESYPSTACAVARLGEAKFVSGEVDSIGAMVPLYIRPSEAELKKGP